MGKFTKDKRVAQAFQYSKNDIYYRKAKEDGYRARSAYKLLQINDDFNIFENAQRIIDLCAAPGSWSQVVSRLLEEKGFLLDLFLLSYYYYSKDKQLNDVRIISIDLQPMSPIENTLQIVGDITKQSTVDEILDKFNQNKAELVICDGAPDVTGFHDIDQYLQTQLLVAALNIANLVLLQNGIFVAKVFKGSDTLFLYSQFKYFFNSVYIVKPKSSRSSSVESFIVCLNYIPPVEFVPKKLSAFESGNENEKIADFINCGDLSYFDEK